MREVHAQSGNLELAEVFRHRAEGSQHFCVAELACHRIAATAERHGADMAWVLDKISARRSAVVGLWHSSAAPATGAPVSSCLNGIAT